MLTHHDDFSDIPDCVIQCNRLSLGVCPHLELLIGAPKFWSRAAADIASAEHRVFVQAMSIEGDSVGLALAAALRDSRATDRRVLVDDYSRVNINDCALGAAKNRLDDILQAEVLATDTMFRNLALSGVPVRRTNPIGRLGLNYPARNHKKLLVTDDVVYLGGINFSDHNFAWLDMMLRIEGAKVAEFLVADFRNTFVGRATFASERFGDLVIFALDGRTNRAGFSAVFASIAAATREIAVVSPYLTSPFIAALAVAANRGVKIRLFTPWPNNKPLVRDALLWAARRYGFDVCLGPVMSHLKGMLIDDWKLILGSSNFDFASFHAEEEFLVEVTDMTVIEHFKQEIISRALAESIVEPSASGRLGCLAYLASRLASAALSLWTGFSRRAVDWSC